MKALRSHHVKEIGKFKPSDARDYARRANVCKQHDDEVRFYCEKCVICICRDCAILDHRDHNIVSLDNGLKNKKSQIENKMQEVQANVTRMWNEKEILEKRRTRMNKSIEQAIEEIHRTAEHNIELIRQHELIMTRRLMEQKVSYEASFSSTLTNLDTKLMEIESSLGFCNDVLERNNLPEILNVKDVLEQRFQELSQPCSFIMKVNCSEFKYVANDLSSLRDSPGKIFISHTDPLLTMADGTGLTEAIQGEDSTFTVITKTSKGETTYSEIDRLGVCIQSLQTKKPLKVNITDPQNGCYNVTYEPDAAGEFNVYVSVSGEAINCSPFQLKVREGKTRAKGTKKGRRELSGKQPPDKINTNIPKCSKCKNLQKDPVYLSECGHYFCKSCTKLFFEKTMICPTCKQERNQPVGYMSYRTETNNSLPGYEEWGTIAMTYNFDGGIQGSDHPNPGEPFRGLVCTSYLPDNPAGQEVCKLLRSAFDAQLMFTIEKSPATGEEYNIICNDIELKTSRSGGPTNCGYPDTSYLDRVKSQLAEKGITVQDAACSDMSRVV